MVPFYRLGIALSAPSNKRRLLYYSLLRDDRAVAGQPGMLQVAFCRPDLIRRKHRVHCGDTPKVAIPLLYTLYRAYQMYMHHLTHIYHRSTPQIY